MYYNINSIYKNNTKHFLINSFKKVLIQGKNLFKINLQILITALVL